MIITSVLGHLMEMEFEEQYRKWHGCDIGALFDAPIKNYVRDQNEDVKKNLTACVRGCSDLILWLDCDREGENICFEVIDACAPVMRCLELALRTARGEVDDEAAARKLEHEIGC